KWLLAHYVRKDCAETDRSHLLARLSYLRQMHLDFAAEFGKSMRADTVFGVDYYLACESVKHGFVYELPHDIHDYEDGVMSGRRRGLAGICVDYWSRYQLPILHTETNFADDEAADWGMKQLLELAQL